MKAMLPGHQKRDMLFTFTLLELILTGALVKPLRTFFKAQPLGKMRGEVVSLSHYFSFIYYCY
jgi:hypothetical protein